VWLGLAGIVDPIRDGVHEVIAAFHAAGIRTAMITGDQSATAQAIGQSLDLAGGEPLEILDSSRGRALPPEVLAGLAPRVHVFSRVSPSRKLKIVKALQDAGFVVAMTGDGINDGPALKAADVGVAMGRDGELFAREVADVILMDDNLAGLLRGIAQGRAIADDLRKSVHFIVSTNLSEVMFTLAAVAAGLGPPLNAKQLLWINLITDVFPELALAAEPPEQDVLQRPPRDPAVPLIPPREMTRLAAESTLITAAAMGSFLYGVGRYGTGPKASTIAFLSLTGAQLLHTISSRSRQHSIFDRGHLQENRYVSWAVGGGAFMEVAAEVVAALRKLLGMERIGLADLGICVGTSFLSFLVNEALKTMRRPGVTA
jgi:Ca2+-transporting ATPase